MTGSNKFFIDIKEKFGGKSYNEMIRYCYLEYTSNYQRTVPTGEILFESQSVGQEFFIILRGSVSVWVGSKGEDYDYRLSDLSESNPVSVIPDSSLRFKSLYEGVPISPQPVLSIVYRNEAGYHVVFKRDLMRKINELSEGSSFGEASLISRDTSLRNATILCETDCCFAVLDKGNYQGIIGEHTQRELNQKLEFLKKVEMFKSFPERIINTMVYFLVEKKYRYRDRIVEQGQIVEKLMILVRGRVKVVPSHPASEAS